MSTVKETLKFPTKFRRFLGLRKIKKRHPNAQILAKGFEEVGWDSGYYWVIVQYKP